MPLSRKKSCFGCRKSKLRCSQEEPACSRCVERSLSCVYEQNSARFSPYGLLEAQQSGESDFMFDLQGQGQLNENWEDVTITTTSIPDAPWPNSPAVTQNTWKTALPPPVAVGDCQDAPLDVGRETMLTESTIDGQSQHGALRQRHIMSHCALGSVIIGQLMSFPQMLADGDKLPPFVFPPCQIDGRLHYDCHAGKKHLCLPKELAICASLVEMFFSRTPNNAEFVWKTIYQEGEKLHRECAVLDKPSLVAALQSATILLLLQSHDPETAEKSESYGLVRTVKALARNISSTTNWYEDLKPGQIDRQEWVFRESIRRTFNSLVLVETMMDGFEGPFFFARSSDELEHPNIPKPTQMVPLPAPRDLWDCSTNFLWRQRFERYSTHRKSNKVLTIKDLLDLDNAGCFNALTRPEITADILPDVFDWCASLDALGTLVWMLLPFHQCQQRAAAQATFG